MSRRGRRGTALGADRGLAAVRSDDRGPAHMPRALRPKLRPPPDGSWIGSRTTRLNREPTQTYAGNGRAVRSLTARGGGFLWIEYGGPALVILRARGLPGSAAIRHLRRDQLAHGGGALRPGHRAQIGFD